MHEFEQILAQSRAAEQFKADVRNFVQGGPAARVAVVGHGPSVKVRRVLAQLLAMEAHMPIERVEIRGQSGCSDFAGVMRVTTMDTVEDIEFSWCCRWRAEQEGWTDYFGFPDQMRAAREFDWRCFESWTRVSVTQKA
ncbi:MAG: hypothetical protein JWO05_2026 [Gemmatimonadetes bacterium]|nr:hypothetical protein [Gemmatimonadota bacterium]